MNNFEFISDLKPKATRQAFGEMLAECGAENKKIVVLDADLSKSTKSEMFAKKFPERFIEMGIAEANMIGTGAGLGLTGYNAFICSFSCFVLGRFDQIRMSIAYAGANVKIIGTHAGVGIGDDGHSQMGLEDFALMRSLPGMVVLQPCDEFETKAAVKFLSTYDGPAFMRLTRQNCSPVHDKNYQFHLGKLDILHTGKSDVAIIATGGVVQESVLAAKMLAAKGLDATIVNVHSIKPFDSTGIVNLAKNCKKIYTVEDHYTTGGLGSCVAEALAQSGTSGVKLVTLGIRDQFGESGEPAELYEKFGISSAKICEQILK